MTIAMMVQKSGWYCLWIEDMLLTMNTQADFPSARPLGIPVNTCKYTSSAIQVFERTGRG